MHIKVLFVCLGNICRSPMAQGMFQKMVDDHGVNHMFEISSRATSSWESGNPPHPGTQKILKRIEASFEHMKSRQISPEDFAYYDYILGMDHDNMHVLKTRAGRYKDKVYLLRDIDSHTKGEIIPDPYYTGHYEFTYQLLKESLQSWFDFFMDIANKSAVQS